MGTAGVSAALTAGFGAVVFTGVALVFMTDFVAVLVAAVAGVHGSAAPRSSEEARRAARRRGENTAGSGPSVEMCGRERPLNRSDRSRVLPFRSALRLR
ncbi:hypothetical protein Abr02nite_10950 [Paractinoplanes brasiliensis]|nr:hypothetical protein Abr02nite_10950 [Actinoplanes brasiliensis]